MSSLAFISLHLMECFNISNWMRLFSDQTTCSYPANVEKKNGEAVVKLEVGEELYCEETVTLACGLGLEMFRNDTGKYRFVERYCSTHFSVPLHVKSRFHVLILKEWLIIEMLFHLKNDL